MKPWKERRKIAAIKNTEPTLTDQAGAASTDLNIIMKQFLKTGTIPGAKGEPIYGDFTEIVTDYRDMLERSRTLADIRKQLPHALQQLPIEELLALNGEQLAAYLRPVSEPETEKPKETTK